MEHSVKLEIEILQLISRRRSPKFGHFMLLFGKGGE